MSAPVAAVTVRGRTFTFTTVSSQGTGPFFMQFQDVSTHGLITCELHHRGGTVWEFDKDAVFRTNTMCKEGAAVPIVQLRLYEKQVSQSASHLRLLGEQELTFDYIQKSPEQHQELDVSVPLVNGDIIVGYAFLGLLGDQSFAKMCQLAPRKSLSGSFTTPPITFRWRYGGNSVSVTGSWDDWQNPLPMRQSGNDWVIQKEAGDMQFPVEFKFIVDGEWCYDKEMDTVRASFNGVEVINNRYSGPDASHPAA